MRFRVDLFTGIVPTHAVNNSIVTTLEFNFASAHLHIYNCGIKDILIDKNMIFGNTYPEFDHGKIAIFKSPLFVNISRKTNEKYKKFFYENDEGFNFLFGDPVPNICSLKPGKEIELLLSADFFRFLGYPGEYEVSFDYISTIDSSQTKYELCPGMDAGCFYSNRQYFIDKGYLFQKSSNLIHFTIVNN